MYNYYVPTVIEEKGNYERVYDIYSRLLKDRIIFISGEVTDSMANAVIAQLLFLNAQDKEKDITMYINSPGGSVSAGLAIIDTMNHVTADVSTVCIGQAASMGAMFLMCGTKGKRYSLPNSRIMIHQPLGGASGQETDVIIRVKELTLYKEKLLGMISKITGNTLKKVYKDTERDNFMSPEEAKKYGIIDRIL